MPRITWLKIAVSGFVASARPGTNG
jgi:hypothetical protein